MKLISIDPSSTRTGLACFDGQDLITTEAITPIDIDPWPRVCKIADWVGNHIDSFRPDTVIVEMGKKVHGHKRWATAGSGMSVYGMAVGAVMWEVHKRQGPGRYEIVDANRWTQRQRSSGRGTYQVTKKTRIGEIEMIYPEQYSANKDAGGDIADAIAMGLWWMENQNIRGRAC